MPERIAAPDFTALVLEHHQAVYRYAFRLTGSVQDAEDLTQEVFLIAQEKLGQLRKIEAFQNWLFAILRNCFLKQSSHKQPIPATDAAMELESFALVHRVRFDGDESDWLQGALNRLPDEYRLVVVMYYFEQHSYREIARQLKIPLGTVMSRLSRGRAYLRRLACEMELGAKSTPPTRDIMKAGKIP